MADVLLRDLPWEPWPGGAPGQHSEHWDTCHHCWLPGPGSWGLQHTTFSRGKTVESNNRNRVSEKLYLIEFYQEESISTIQLNLCNAVLWPLVADFVDLKCWIHPCKLIQFRTF